MFSRQTREQRLKELEEHSENHIRALCAKDGNSAEQTEEEVARGRKEVHKSFEENERKSLGFSRLHKVLKSRFANELSSEEFGRIKFPKLAFEIKPHTVSEKELTDLVMLLEKNRTLQKEYVEENLLKPLIARNPEYIQQKMERAEQRRLAAEQKIARYRQEKEELKQEKEELKREYAKLMTKIAEMEKRQQTAVASLSSSSSSPLDGSPMDAQPFLPSKMIKKRKGSFEEEERKSPPLRVTDPKAEASPKKRL